MSNLDSIINLIKQAAKKLETSPASLGWNDFQKFLKESYDNPDWENIKQDVSDAGGWKTLKTVYFGEKVTHTALKLKSEATKIRKASKKAALKSLIAEETTAAIAKNFGEFFYTLPKLPKREAVLERHQHLIISDTHFGSDLDPSTGVRAYGAEEESRSMAKIVTGTLDFKTNHRRNTKLFVNILGDIIQGKIHDPQSSADLAIQICRAIYVLGKSLHILASEFPEVEVNCATGNHDRDPSVHHDRASTDKYNSFATPIYYALKQQLAHLPNVKFNISKAPFFGYESFGANYWCTHGDNQIKVPNPMGAINVGSLENEINKINARPNTPKYDVFMVGHIHTGMKITMKNGTTLITNPPLIPTDQYALSLNLSPDSPTGQQLFESVPGYPCGDLRTLWVTEEDRKNQSLDSIIQPFSGL